MLSQLFTVLFFGWVALALIGMLGYFIGRLRGKILPPPPQSIGGVESLGACRLISGLAALVGVLWLMVSGGPNASLLLLGAGLIAGVGWACPPNVTIGRLKWSGVAAAAGLVPLVVSEAAGIAPFDRYLWLVIGLMSVAWYARKHWALPVAAPIAQLTAQPSFAMPGSAGSAGAALPTQRQAPTQPQRQSSGSQGTLTLAAKPHEVIDEIGRSFVGQPQALQAWEYLLLKNEGLFAGQSTRPLVVLHAGPSGSGRETLARDLARIMGCHEPEVMGPLDDWHRPPSPFVIFKPGDERYDSILQTVTTRGLGWHHSIFVGLVDAPDLPVDETSQQKLRASLAGLVAPKLAAVATVIPFRRLDAHELAGVAVRVLVEEGERLGIAISRIEPAVAAAVVLHVSGAMREGGAEGIPHAATDLLGRTLDVARAQGIPRASLTMANNAINVTAL